MDAISDKDRFQYWLMEMDNAIEAFVEAIPADRRTALDGSEGSLDALEALILQRYAGVAETRAPAEAKFLDGAARYFGEVLRRQTGSRWGIRFDDPKFVFHGLPILSGGKIGTMPECPLTVITASTDRRTGTYLSNLLRHFSRSAAPG